MNTAPIITHWRLWLLRSQWRIVLADLQGIIFHCCKDSITRLFNQESMKASQIYHLVFQRSSKYTGFQQAWDFDGMRHLLTSDGAWCMTASLHRRDGRSKVILITQVFDFHMDRLNSYHRVSKPRTHLEVRRYSMGSMALTDTYSIYT